MYWAPVLREQEVAGLAASSPTTTPPDILFDGVRQAIHHAERLDPLEQSVVALSLFDHRSSIETPSGARRWLSKLFGTQAAYQLANHRLEALRRYAILLRFSCGSMPIEERNAMHRLGFTDLALEEIHRLVQRAKANPADASARKLS